jgi:predicted transcriptional regulator
MKTISLKIDDSIYGETESIVKTMKKARNRYINEALAYYNKMQSRTILESKLKMESELVSKSSMEVLKDYEKIDTIHESI